MRPGKKSRPWESKLCVAEQVFKRDVLAILLSDLRKGQEEHSSDIKERSCTNAVSVIIMNAEICWSKDFHACTMS